MQGIFRQAVFRPKSGDLQKKKKSSSSQKRHEIRCQSTKNTNLGLHLHSSSPNPVNFFGAQPRLGGAQFSFGVAQAVVWGARPRYAPSWRRVWSSQKRFKFMRFWMKFLSNLVIGGSSLRQCAA